MSLTIAALDVGGTSIKSGVVRFGVGDELPTVDLGPSMPTLAQSPDADTIVARLAEMVDHALRVDPAAEGLAIAICGPFDIERGVSMMRGVHKFEAIFGLDLRREFVRRTSIGERPIRFARDAESAGTGEALAGAGLGVQRLLMITLGTGLGACVLVDARPVPTLVAGTSQTVIEIDHTGMRETPWGRADDVLSARGLADRLGLPIDGLRMAVADPANADVVADHGTRLGTFLQPLVSDFDVDLVVIGGAVSAEFERFGPAAQAAIGATPVRPASLGPAGPLLGAAQLAFR